MIDAFGALDLHMIPDGTLSSCTGTNSSMTDANSLSFGLTLDSL